MIDPLVAHMGDMKQAIDAAEIDKGAIVGDVFYNAFDYLVFD